MMSVGYLIVFIVFSGGLYLGALGPDLLQDQLQRG